jgi:hypothetical protein
MPAADLLKAAAGAAHDLAAEASARSFRKRVRDFIDALARIPDYPATEFKPLEIEQLSSTAEHVIAATERRIDHGDDSPSVKQELAESIYDIRARLEEIGRWRRHYLQSPTS